MQFSTMMTIAALLCLSAPLLVSGDTPAFKQWISGKLTSSKVELAGELGKGGRGVVASEDIKAGDTILEIPFDLLMTLKTASDSPIGKMFTERQFSPTMILALHLLHESYNPDSAWKAWFDVIPRTFETPIFWAEEDLVELTGATILSVARRRLETLKEDFAAINAYIQESHPTAFTAEQLTLDSFTWAVSTVWSRSLIFNVDNSLIPVIVPFADMIDHANTVSDFALDDETQAFKITVQSEYKKGDPVYVSLGNKPNSQLLLSYGFVLADNPYDTVLINMFLNNQDPFYDIKAKMLEAQGQPPSTLYYLNNRDVPSDFLNALRVQLLKPSELDDYAKIFDGQSISMENELDCLRQIISACDQLLKQYPSSIQEDAALIQAPEFAQLSDRQQTAVYLRFGEKRVLHRTVEAVSQLWSQYLIDGYKVEK